MTTEQSAVVKIHQDPEEAWKSIEKLMILIAKRFAESHRGIDFSEAMSDVGEAFVKALQVYDGRIPFSHFVAKLATRRMQQSFRKLPSADIQSMEGDHLPSPDRSDFTIEKFRESLSRDAKVVVDLAINTPSGMQRMFEMRGGRPRNWRSVIRDHLSESGWSITRIYEAFQEITFALTIQ